MITITVAGLDIFLEEPERYIQINDSTEAALRAAWPTIASSYPGYEFCFCFRNCHVPTGLMGEIGAELLEDCIEMRLPRTDIAYTPSPDIVLVTEANFDIFGPFHDKCNPPPDMYWTSRRIREDLSRWMIYMHLEDGQINGYCMNSMWQPDGEIFCIEAPNLEIGKALTATVLAHTFEAGKPEMLNMVTEGTLEQEISVALGFAVTGFYTAYRILPTN